MLTQACHSLHEAHRRQLIHRDIKPANLFVCEYGEDRDFVKVLDFGLVKRHVDIEGEEHESVTQVGTIAGTPAFMAPERAVGSRDVDPRIDIYSLGCVGYWLLTGRLVFEGDSPMGVIIQHVSTEPAPPSGARGAGGSARLRSGRRAGRADRFAGRFASMSLENRMTEIIVEQKAQGRTILFSTHVLEQADVVGSTTALIKAVTQMPNDEFIVANDQRNGRIAEIARANGLTPLSSATNFVTIDCGAGPDFAKAVLQALIERDIFVRMPFAAPGNRCIRISCGTEADLDLFEAALPLALSAAKGD